MAMKPRLFAVAAAALIAPLAASAQSAFTSLHPEEQYADPPAQATAHPYSDFIMQVQQSLRAHGFDGGPPNGDFGTKTQAALTQFQLSRNIPASGQLDDQTLAELGVSREQASAGATTPPADEEGSES
jgi:peptidoglycan hydrolase-like protein with peptidoglycan-binding domain